MKPSRFLNDKLKKQLAANGIDISFIRMIKNEYGEIIEDQNSVIKTIKGIYHEANGYVSETVSDATVYRSKKTPMILTDVENIKILLGDADVPFTEVDYKLVTLKLDDNRIYSISGIVDVQEYGVAFDISLIKKDSGR